MKYGKEITDQLVELIAGGMKREDSCDMIGINQDTFYAWLKDKRKPEFSEAIKKAEMACKQRNIARIQNASKKNWQAAAWWLERKYPEEFAIRQKLEHSGPNGGPIPTKTDVDLSRLTDAQLVRLADVLERNQPKE